MIAWKRDMFDLFRSGEMELNRCRTSFLYELFELLYIRSTETLLPTVFGSIKDISLCFVRRAPVLPTSAAAST